MLFEYTKMVFGIVTAAWPSVAAGVAETMLLSPLVPSGPFGVPLRTCQAGPSRDFNLLHKCIFEDSFSHLRNEKKNRLHFFTIGNTTCIL